MFKLSIYFVLALFAGSRCQDSKLVDICGVTQTLYDNGGRDVACGDTGRSSHELCDSERSERWYTVVANSDTDPTYHSVDMPTECPKIGQCGAKNPLWLNGSLPTDENVMAVLTACMAGNSSCCEETYPIYVKKCSSFYSYYLKKTPRCSVRYCFGNSTECPHRNPTKSPIDLETTKSQLGDMTTKPYWERTTRPYWDRTTRPYWDRTTRPYWERTTRPYWERTTRPYWDRTTRPYWERTTRPYWDRTTRPYWDRTTRPYWERTTRPYWDRTTRPYWERTTRPYWDRTTKPYWERTTRPYWDRTTRPYWDRTTRPWWERTTRPYWDRTTRPWWERTTRPYWDRTTKPYWERTTKPYWERTTLPWWVSTTHGPTPEEIWMRRYRHLLRLSERNTILSGVSLLLLTATVVSVVASLFCKCRNKRRRANYALFQPATITTGSFKA